MPCIGADYLGGNPHVVGGTDVSGTLAAQEGALRFEGSRLDASQSPVRAEFALAKESLRAITAGAATDLKRLTETILATRRVEVLLVACESDDHAFVCSFGVDEGEGRGLVDAIQRGRVGRGEPPLPTVEALAGRPAEAATARQLAALEDIREQVAELTEAVRRLAEAQRPDEPG